MMSNVVAPLDKRLSFNEVPEIYDEIRPSYPAALYEALFRMLPPQPTILEVGPGTGQATKDLLARGASVHAVEIGPATAAKLRSNLPIDELKISIADFEQLPVSERVDAVFSATAFHWISPRGQTDRPAELLKPGGLIAVVDLIQVASPSDRGYFDAAQPIYERYGQADPSFTPSTHDNADPPMRARLEGDQRYTDVSVLRWHWDQSYSASRYRKLMLSYSGTQMMPANDQLGLLDDIESFIEHHFEGHVTRPLVVTLTTARLN